MNDVALVTGANKGIGRQIALRLAERGLTVYGGARNPVDLGGDIRWIRLDVTDEEAIRDAVELIGRAHGRLDALVNNAGVCADYGLPATEVTAEQMRRTYEVNVFGVVAMTRAFIQLLRKSAGARVVNLSSPLGSLDLIRDFDSPIAQHTLLAYGSSKSAVGAITLIYARALAGDGILVNAANPGYVATDLNGHRGVLPVERGADVPVRLALLDRDGPTGLFVGRHATGLAEADGLAELLVPW